MGVYKISEYARNSSYVIPGVYDIETVDVGWVLIASIIIFTMQTGFGLLESGIVSKKNQVNIMMKNVVDVVLGGFTYWLFGYGLSYGRSEYTTPFIAIGDFMVDPTVRNPLMGQIFTAFFFQLSFATTATTIVSGAIAERFDFHAYCLFSFVNTIVYCIPAGWVWGEHGFLHNLGVVDIAGSGPVHLIGGASAFASAIMVGPRLGRYDKGTDPLPMSNPINVCVGLLFLWFGWIAFNSGSTYGLTGAKWEYSARAAVMTILASFGGGIASLFYSLAKNKGKLEPADLINGILGALVGITAGCLLFRAWESMFVGVVGAILPLLAIPLIDKMKIDDCVGASAVHGVSGIWGVLAVGLFSDNPIALGTTNGRSGLFKGGGWYLLGVQSLSVMCLLVWGLFATFLILWIINKIIPIRMSAKYQMLGADYTEHNIKQDHLDTSPVTAKCDTRDSVEILKSQLAFTKVNNKQENSIEIVENNARENSFNDNAAFDHDAEGLELSMPNNLYQTRSNLDN